MSQLTHYLQKALNDLATQKAQEILEKARKSLAGTEATRDLINSLSVNVIKATATKEPVIQFSFKDEGRYLDYKKPVWNKVADIKRMVEWVKARGVGNFGYVSGVGRTAISEDKKILRIAEGIAWSMRKHQIKWKPKGWKRKTLVKLLQDLNQQTALIWQAAVVKSVEDELVKN